ncbi:hypothetical protein SAMN05216317_101133 [Nitrosomonas eutropha]|uniref:hypothetical protein n=1 Tax=Nitrosomonas sp. GH22 TaxID=153947 RepID=UPI000890C915|nr:MULTISPECIES: hypothetical protein [Nitrosomonas]SCX28079.1 hypothetical protein SAMN05216379_14211 [Nitrosomonas eutropha]SDW01500.1 hypothetical protein SAMN05216317_101133 [Nitrosomonas eutropha]
MAMNRIQFQEGLSLPAFLGMSNVRMHWKRHVGRKDSAARAAATQITTYFRQENTRTSNVSATSYRHL